jgi:hypothetical protein
MASIINGSSPTVTFSDGTTQATSAIVSGYVPYANLPAGSVLQVVNATTGTPVTNATSTFVDTTLTASITPKFSTSKILINVCLNGTEKNTSNANNSLAFRLVKDSTVLVTFAHYFGWTNSGSSLVTSTGAMTYLDSPATTSSTQYKVQFANENNGSAVFVNSNSSISGITLMEIAA